MIDQIGAIVVGNNAHARRQRLVDLLHGCGQPLSNDARVLAQRHQRDANHRLAVALARHRAEPRHRRLDNFCDVLDVERRPAGCRAQHDVADVADRLQQPFAADDGLLTVAGNRRAADGAVVLRHRVVDVLDREAKVRQRVLVNSDLVGLELAAVGVDLGYARDQLELRRDLPIQDRTQLHERVVLAVDPELVDLGEAVGEGPEQGCPGFCRQ